MLSSTLVIFALLKLKILQFLRYIHTLMPHSYNKYFSLISIQTITKAQENICKKNFHLTVVNVPRNVY
jgi:hypothetical protein